MNIGFGKPFSIAFFSVSSRVLPQDITVFSSSFRATHNPLYFRYIVVQSIAVIFMFNYIPSSKLAL